MFWERFLKVLAIIALVILILGGGAFIAVRILTPKYIIRDKEIEMPEDISGNAVDPSTGSGSEQGITPTPKGNAFDPSTGSGSEQGITPTPTGNASDPSTGSEQGITPTPNGNAFDPSTSSGSEQGITYPDPVREVNEYVWTIQRADIMSNAVSKSDEKQIGGEGGFVLVTVEEGERLKRTGIHENGMSRVEFEGYTGFVDTGKLSRVAPTPTPKSNAFDPSTGSGSEQGITSPTVTVKATSTPTPTVKVRATATPSPTPTVTLTPTGNAFDPSTGSGSEQGITYPVPTATLYPEITGNVVKTETNDYGKGEIGTTEYYSDGSSVEKVTVPGKGISTITILADGTRIEEADYDDYKTIMYPNDVLWTIGNDGVTTVTNYGTGESFYIRREELPYDGAIMFFRYPKGDGKNAYICNSDGSKNRWSDRLYNYGSITFGGGTKTVNLWGVDGQYYKLYVDDGPFYDY